MLFVYKLWTVTAVHQRAGPRSCYPSYWILCQHGLANKRKSSLFKPAAKVYAELPVPGVCFCLNYRSPPVESATVEHTDSAARSRCRAAKCTCRTPLSRESWLLPTAPSLGMFLHLLPHATRASSSLDQLQKANKHMCV